MPQTVDLETVRSWSEELDAVGRQQLACVEAALGRRLRGLTADAPISETDEGRPVSGVVEYRPYADGTLQKEVRRYYRRDGTPKEQGPYWYFRYHVDGKQKKLYLGKTDDPEGMLERRRTSGATTWPDGTCDNLGDIHPTGARGWNRGWKSRPKR